MYEAVDEEHESVDHFLFFMTRLSFRHLLQSKIKINRLHNSFECKLKSKSIHAEMMRLISLLSLCLTFIRHFLQSKIRINRFYCLFKCEFKIHAEAMHLFNSFSLCLIFVSTSSIMKDQNPSSSFFVRNLNLRINRLIQTKTKDLN